MIEKTRVEIIKPVHKAHQVQQVPPGEDGTNGTDGRDGTDGTNGTDGRPGENGTNIDPCVACLLDALVKLDSGAILVNISAAVIPQPEGNLFEITIPLVIDVDVSTLFQQQIAISLGLPTNATIFEICTAIDSQGLFDIRDVISCS